MFCGPQAEDVVAFCVFFKNELCEKVIVAAPAHTLLRIMPQRISDGTVIPIEYWDDEEGPTASEMREIIARKEAELLELDEKNRSLDAKIATRKSEKKGKEAEIARLESEMKGKNARLAVLGAEHKGKDTLIQSMKNLVREVEQFYQDLNQVKQIKQARNECTEDEIQRYKEEDIRLSYEALFQKNRIRKNQSIRQARIKELTELTEFSDIESCERACVQVRESHTMRELFQHHTKETISINTTTTSMLIVGNTETEERSKIDKCEFSEHAGIILEFVDGLEPSIFADLYIPA